MAYEILRDRSAVSHTPAHDLKSLIYILIWISVVFSGPDSTIRPDLDLVKSMTNSWVKGDYAEIAACKHGCILMQTFEPHVTQH